MVVDDRGPMPELCARCYEFEGLKPAPAFSFYPADWLADSHVRAMTPSQRGIYIDLLAHCWREGSLPTDMTALLRMCSLRGRQQTALKEPLRCFQRCHCGRSFFHKRLDTEWRKQIARSEKCRSAVADRERKRAIERSSFDDRSMILSSSSSSPSSFSSPVADETLHKSDTHSEKTARARVHERAREARPPAGISDGSPSPVAGRVCEPSARNPHSPGSPPSQARPQARAVRVEPGIVGVLEEDPTPEQAEAFLASLDARPRVVEPEILGVGASSGDLADLRERIREAVLEGFRATHGREHPRWTPAIEYRIEEATPDVESAMRCLDAAGEFYGQRAPAWAWKTSDAKPAARFLGLFKGGHIGAGSPGSGPRGAMGAAAAKLAAKNAARATKAGAA